MRLIAVLTVMAGFALLHTPQCADGMSPAMHLAATAEQTMSDMAGAGHSDHSDSHDQDAITDTAAVAMVGTAGDGSSSSRSVLMSCLALLITMLGALVLLRRSEIPLGTLVLKRSGPHVRPRSAPRTDLMRLCVLRT